MVKIQAGLIRFLHWAAHYAWDNVFLSSRFLLVRLIINKPITKKRIEEQINPITTDVGNILLNGDMSLNGGFKAYRTPAL
jgi:hypothetical protein